MEAGEEVGFPDGDGMVGGVREAGEGGGAGKDGIDVVPDWWWSHAPIGGKDPWEEEAVACGGAIGVFGGFFGGTSVNDGVGVVDSGSEVGREERAADGKVNGCGLLGKG